MVVDSGNVGMAPATATSPAPPVLTLVHPAEEKEAYPVVVLLLDGRVEFLSISPPKIVPPILLLPVFFISRYIVLN